MKASLRLLPSFALLMLVLFSLAGCNKEQPKHVVRFYVETSGKGNMGTWSKVMTLKNSGLTFTVNSQPAILETSLDNVELMKTEDGQLFVAFYFDDVGSRELYRQSVAAMGRRIVLEVNGVPLGARQFDGALTSGVLFMFVDLPDSELGEFVLNLKESVEAIKRMKR